MPRAVRFIALAAMLLLLGVIVAATAPPSSSARRPSRHTALTSARSSRCDTGPGAHSKQCSGGRCRIVSPSPSMARLRFTDAVARLYDARRQVDAEPRRRTTPAEAVKRTARIKRLREGVRRAESALWFAYCQLNRPQRVALSRQLDEALRPAASSRRGQFAVASDSRRRSRRRLAMNFARVEASANVTLAPVDAGLTFVADEFATTASESARPPTDRDKTERFLKRKALELIMLLPEEHRGRAIEVLLKLGGSVKPILAPSN